MGLITVDGQIGQPKTKTEELEVKIMSAKNWYRFENKADDSVNIYVYDEISLYGINASDFVKDLNNVTAKTINLFINSPGGNVFDGVTMYNALKRHSAKVHVTIDGLAASIASVIAMAGDTIDIAKNAMIMVHRAWSYQVGNKNDMIKMADMLDKIDINTIITSYTDKTGLTSDELIPILDAETWISAQEAKDMGFVDSVGGDTDAKGSFKLLNKFNNTPQHVLNRFAEKAQTSERDIEQFLRDAGVSRTKAKAVLAAVRNEDQRDAESEISKLKAYREMEACKSLIKTLQITH